MYYKYVYTTMYVVMRRRGRNLDALAVALDFCGVA